MLVKMETGASGGGGNVTLDTIKFTGTISSSTKYKFEKDFAYVVLLDVTNVNNPSWYSQLVLNGSAIPDAVGGQVSGTMGSAASYTRYIGFPNVKTNDELANTSGSSNYFMLGFVS